MSRTVRANGFGHVPTIIFQNHAQSGEIHSFVFDAGDNLTFDAELKRLKEIDYISLS